MDPPGSLSKLKLKSMSVTEKLIRQLKRSVNPDTGKGFEYDAIGALLGMTKQGVRWHVTQHPHDCAKCLRPLQKPKTKK